MTALKKLSAVAVVVSVLLGGCSVKSSRFSSRTDPTALAVAGGVIGAAIIGQAVSGWQREKTLQDVNRSRTLLNAPCAFGGEGEAIYESSAGYGDLRVLKSNRTPENCAEPAQVSAPAPQPQVTSPYAVCDRWPFLSRARLDCRRTVYRELERATQRAARDAAREAIERGGY